MVIGATLRLLSFLMDGLFKTNDTTHNSHPMYCSITFVEIKHSSSKYRSFIFFSLNIEIRGVLHGGNTSSSRSTGQLVTGTWHLQLERTMGFTQETQVSKGEADSFYVLWPSFTIAIIYIKWYVSNRWTKK